MAEFGKNVGEDVLEEPILSILPPKTLMRFKCVSKQWYALINNPYFVAKHLSNSMHNNTRVLVKLKDTNTDPTTEEVFSLLKFCHDNDNGEHSFLANYEDVDIPLLMSLKTRGESLDIIGHCNGIICLAMANSWEVLLWNPSIEEFKLLPTMPYLPYSSREDHDSISPQEAWRMFKDALGFGYCPKSNDYKVINALIESPDYELSSQFYIIHLPPTAAVYTMGTDSWREAKSYALETETTIIWPQRFQVYFKGMFYWLGQEQHKEMTVYNLMDEEFIRDMIIFFDLSDEVFHPILLPDSLYEYCYNLFCYNMRLLVWNESIALLGMHNTESLHCHLASSSFGIWVKDEYAWTKHVTFELSDEKPLTFLNDEILMVDTNGCLFSYNTSTKNLKYLPIQIVSNDFAAVVYVDSIVSLLGGNKLGTGDESTNVDFSLYKYSPFSYSMIDKGSHSYSIWAIPLDDVSLRIKKVMEGLRAQFSGPEIEPHISVVGSIRMTHDEALRRFRSLQSLVIHSYKAKVEKVVTRKYYYQCVSLCIDDSIELWNVTLECSKVFDFYIEIKPRLSLLCGNLTVEERKLAQQSVSIMDESITSLTFPISRLALYKIDSKDRTLKSWEKIAEYPLLFD